MQVRLTLKNYRCFSEQQPVLIDFGKQFISFIGPNNSGKSALLKSFYELRNLWNPFLNQILYKTRKKECIKLKGVSEAIEIFTKDIEKSILIELEFYGNYSASSNLPTIEKIRYILSQKPDHLERDEVLFRAELLSPSIEGICEENQCSFTDDGILQKHKNNQDREPILDCSPLLNFHKAISNSMYIGAFRNAITLEGHRPPVLTNSAQNEEKIPDWNLHNFKNYYDLHIGYDFIRMWHHLKNNSGKQNSELAYRVQDDICSIFNFSSFEMSSSQSEKTLNVFIDKKVYSLREIGAGIAQFIVVLVNAAFTNPVYIFIDEPELNLHPSFQTKFLDALASYSSGGVIFATHSLGLARSASEQIYSIKRENGISIVTPFEDTPNYIEFLGSLSFASQKEIGADSILLVEGIKDVKLIQQFLRILGKEHSTVVLPLGGEQMINGKTAHELLEIKKLTDNVFVLIDSEKKYLSQTLSKGRHEFVENCKEAGFHVCVTAHRAFENYLSEKAIQAFLGLKYRALEPFEKLSDCEHEWSKSDNWRIARLMTRDEFINTDIGLFLNEL